MSPSLSAYLFGTGTSGVSINVVLHFIYWLGLLLLMFISGSETRRLLAVENRREIAWIIGVGTPLPFFFVLGLGLADFLPLQALVGTAGQETSALLVLAIAVAVTSIPVISRIFYDLRILHTRFASLILGSAVLEDIILWGVLAIATALATSATLAQQYVVSNITAHVTTTVVYMGLGLTVAPSLLKWLHNCRWNFLVKTSPVGYTIIIMLVYAALAAALNVTLVFAAFLAGFGLVGGMDGSQRHRFAEPLELHRESRGCFFYSDLLWHGWIQVGLRGGPLCFHVGDISLRLHRDVLGVSGSRGAVSGISRVGRHESGSSDECARRSRDRSSDRRLWNRKSLMLCSIRLSS